ncbi:diguanylate cyclase (plasmid) [Deinococcus sp. D7000]|nr:diguanylate cyclase [Deinococcus sp. D7000]
MYRISGDEFALLLPEGPPFAGALVDAVTQDVQAHYPAASASVGTVRRQVGETGDAWLLRADRAMYQHKRRNGSGRSTGGSRL